MDGILKKNEKLLLGGWFILMFWVLIIGIAWEIFEVYVEGTEETYGTKQRWAINTASDVFVETAAAWWMVI